MLIQFIKLFVLLLTYHSFYPLYSEPNIEDFKFPLNSKYNSTFLRNLVNSNVLIHQTLQGKQMWNRTTDLFIYCIRQRKGWCLKLERNAFFYNWLLHKQSWKLARIWKKNLHMYIRLTLVTPSPLSSLLPSQKLIPYSLSTLCHSLEKGKREVKDEKELLSVEW